MKTKGNIFRETSNSITLMKSAISGIQNEFYFLVNQNQLYNIFLDDSNLSFSKKNKIYGETNPDELIVSYQ